MQHKYPYKPKLTLPSYKCVITVRSHQVCHVYVLHLSTGEISLIRLITADKINTTDTLTIQAADGGNPPCTETIDIPITFTDAKTIRFVSSIQ